MCFNPRVSGWLEIPSHLTVKVRSIHCLSPSKEQTRGVADGSTLGGTGEAGILATPLVVPGKIPQMRHLCQGPATALVGRSNAPERARHRAAVNCSVSYTNHTPGVALAGGPVEVARRVTNHTP